MNKLDTLLSLARKVLPKCYPWGQRLLCLDVAIMLIILKCLKCSYSVPVVVVQLREFDLHHDIPKFLKRVLTFSLPNTWQWLLMSGFPGDDLKSECPVSQKLCNVQNDLRPEVSRIDLTLYSLTFPVLHRDNKQKSCHTKRGYPTLSAIGSSH